jgi:DNA-directed RNA polymerase specialized sigma subunit
MLLDSKKANEMQAAVDAVFSRLPKIFKTEETRNEIAKNVVRSEDEYHEAARRTVLSMFASIDRAIENRKKLANFK